MTAETLARAIGGREFTTTNRRAAVEVYRYLRDLILSGDIPPDTILSQLELARLLGVSRTPVREAVRMLQKEGMVDAAPDRRAKVTGFDPLQLDSAYASRILIECLAVSMTVPQLTVDECEQIQGAVDVLLSPACRENLVNWRHEHTAFHGLTTKHAPVPLQNALNENVTRCRRFLILYQVRHQSSWWLRGENEHLAIAEACIAKDTDAAVSNVARHLARTALDLVAELAPEIEPAQTRSALRLVTKAANGNG